MNLFIFFCVLCYLNFVCCSQCNSQKTCGECIGYALERCVWCSKEDFDQPKCQSENSSNINRCQNSIINPQQNVTYVQNDDFSASVQFRPQQIFIKARPGVLVNFTMSYKSADDFPLDVYFVMDYSYTMKTHSEALKQQALEIYEGLKKLTKNVRLGVGSFIEKPGLPYADENAAKTYAFRNHLSLTKDMDQFTKVISKSEFGSNYDDAEAGLDALMQVMTCESILGWRNQTRRIIVLATDSTYHSAGDGKMLGAIKPNDMKCHLNGSEYDRNLAMIYDYPSVGQINKIAAEGQFKIIFAALLRVKPVYEALSKQILGARYAELKNNSNIVQIIKAAYEESVKQVELDYKKGTGAIQLKIDQDCEADPPTNCESSPLNPIVYIPAVIKSTDCPKDGLTEQIVTINPLGLNDKLTIRFQVDCLCECEKVFTIELSTICNNNGAMRCGACKCNDNRGGDHCEFNCSEDLIRDSSPCVEPNSTLICNNRGTCNCGKCECNDERFTGAYCQYHDGLCLHKNDKVCAGNGHCKEGKCVCDDFWTGDGCDCTVHNTQCRGPFSSKVCSGRGECKCGKCICDTIGGTEKYLGAFCDSCEECAKERCEELKDYAHCNLLEEKDNCDKKFNYTTNIQIALVNKTDFNSVLDMGTKCSVGLDDGTFLVFKYQTDPVSRGMQLVIQNEVDQPPEADIWVPVGSAIAGIILIGILTAIIWKILIDISDKRDYEKFCEEAKAQGYDVSENPLYEPPTQNFVNPEFNQQQRIR